MIRQKTDKNSNNTKFLRDGRAPIPEKEMTSRLMSANKSKNTKPEIIIRKALWKNGNKGYRLHWRKTPGKPDIAYPGKKVAVFINGCFWHRCPHCNLPLPKSNSGFWKEKFERNIIRDNHKIQLLHNATWKTIIVWECEIKRDINSCLVKIKNAI
jgi:DNA mismatch endonuclease (patch repair protein)